MTPGTKLGPYEIVSLVGAGGMGEVYRARDTKLGRDVALKLLPDSFTHDPERVARFRREAQVLASLNHPHIAQIHGLDEANGAQVLVLELVDGESLDKRIARGPVPVDEALDVGRQLAEGLEAAHEKGIIHRDLKPANIALTTDGQIKILDFGLAKATEAAAGTATNIANSPTITSPVMMTGLGVILGTATYMSPEQARGQTADRRADIWAFGCVLYEMLTGRRAFDGDDVTDILAAIVRAEPDWSRLPAETPSSIRTLLKRALEKSPRDRLPDIGAARLELRDAQAMARSDVKETAAGVTPRRRLSWLPWAIAGALALIVLVGAGFVLRDHRTRDDRVFKTMIIPPAPLSKAPALRLSISPDGRRLAFVAPDASGSTVLWVRRMDDIDAHPLTGTADASSPFWSPNSQSIAFYAEGKLRRVDAEGGDVTTLCDAAGQGAPPGSWGRQDVILFTGATIGATRSIQRVPATGGQPVDVIALPPETVGGVPIAPVFLPDQRHFLYTITSGTGGARTAGIYAASLESKTGTRILEASSNAAYAGGYLVYLHETTLMAQPFDPDRLALSGNPVPLALDVQINPATGTGAFSVSQTGVLVYQSGPSSGTQPTWFDRTGTKGDNLGAAGGYRDVQLSPDNQWASLTLTDDRGHSPEVWLFDIPRRLPHRFTFGGGFAAVWSPNGQRIAYALPHDNGSADLLEKDVNGATMEEPLLRDGKANYPLAFSPDGKYLLYAILTGPYAGMLHLLPLEGERKPRPLLQDGTTKTPAEVSPDGQWLAYVAVERGRRQVFVTSFPDAAGKWQISTNGGDSPRWSADGKELFFTSASGAGLMAAEIASRDGRFDSGAVRQLFELHVPAPELGTRSTYAPTRDGQRFLVNTYDTRAALNPIVVIVNWQRAIKH